MAPTIEGTVHDFVNSGLYDGLFVLEDKETKTLWSHMTGEALYGEQVGKKMEVSNLLQIDVEQALTLDSTVQIAISDRPYINGDEFTGGRWDPDNEDVEMLDFFAETLGKEDTRLERMEMGLGIWDENFRRYYPVRTIREKGRYLIDEVDGQTLLVYLDPLTSTPTALYWDTEEVIFEGRNLLLKDGYVIRNGKLFDSAGEPIDAEAPNQMYSRWYGFSLTFPGPEIVQ